MKKEIKGIRVFPDTCIHVAGSICASVEVITSLEKNQKQGFNNSKQSSCEKKLYEIKHIHYEECAELMEFLKENAQKNEYTERIGVSTERIKNEAKQVFLKAYTDAFQKFKEKFVGKSLDIQNARVVGFNICADNLKKITYYLQIVNIPKKEEEAMFELVDFMYDDIIAETISRLELFPEMKSIPSSIQLNHLLENKTDINDKYHLADAAYMRKKGYQVYFVTKDSHFKPIRDHQGKIISQIVTLEIENRFGIVCDGPKEIYNKLLHN